MFVDPQALSHGRQQSTQACCIISTHVLLPYGGCVCTCAPTSSLSALCPTSFWHEYSSFSSTVSHANPCIIRSYCWRLLPLLLLPGTLLCSYDACGACGMNVDSRIVTLTHPLKISLFRLVTYSTTFWSVPLCSMFHSAFHDPFPYSRSALHTEMLLYLCMDFYFLIRWKTPPTQSAESRRQGTGSCVGGILGRPE